MPVKVLKGEQPTTAGDVRKLQETVAGILGRVRERGDAALRELEREFDRFEPASFRVTPDEAAKAKGALPSEIVEELDFAIKQVTAFAEAQKAAFTEFEREIAPGMRMGHRLIPVDSCGCYVPAGRYPCLTSAVMSVAPAKVAGVRRIVACSPPGPYSGINLGILYTMHAMGVDEIYCFGGAQAIAALAYGTETIAPVDLIVGPGNQWVTEAKRQVFGTVGIDFLAGPSECLVLADETADAELVAADLLAQCEHDPNARGAVVSTSERLACAVGEQVAVQLGERTTRETAGASWQAHGQIVVADTMAEAAAYVNDYAPEHLELHVADPRAVLPLLTSYGSLFLGENTAEVYADKIAGPNHILPTGRAARYTGGLWVGMFLKVVTHMEVDVPTSLKLAKYAEDQARYEGMDAHRHAATLRLQRLRR